MKDTPIEWADDTDNIVEGCTEVDEECSRCYAKGIAARFSGHQMIRDGSTGEVMGPNLDKPLHYHGLARFSSGRRLPLWTGQVRLRPDVLDAMFWRLLRARTPRKQFLCSMGDLFHAEVPDAYLDEVFARVAILESRRSGEPHPILMLTKRPERAADYTTAPDVEKRVEAAAWNFIARERESRTMGTGSRRAMAQLIGFRFQGWPLRSVALITSAGRQESAEIRIPHLMRARAAIRGVSCEPMLGRVDFTRWLWPEPHEPGLDWGIGGGESGEDDESPPRGAELEWFDSMADQFRYACVPFFMKQLGTVLAAKLNRPGKGGKLGDLPERLRVRQFPFKSPQSLT